MVNWLDQSAKRPLFRTEIGGNGFEVGLWVDLGDGLAQLTHSFGQQTAAAVRAIPVPLAMLVERVSYDAYGMARHHHAADINGDGAVTQEDYDMVTSNLGNFGVGNITRTGTVGSRDQSLANDSLAALPPGEISKTDNIVGYAGYLFNAEIHGAGRYTVRHRHYAPDLGRWLTRDPIGYVDGMNLYEYVRSGALRFLDPLGLSACGPPPHLQTPAERRYKRELDNLRNQLYPGRTGGTSTADLRCAIVATSTFLVEVTPSIEVNFGIYESIDDSFSCCKDGTIHQCKRSGFRLLFGIKAEFEAKWGVELPVWDCDTCPVDGRYTEMLGGFKGRGRMFGANVKTKLRAGYRLGPNGLELVGDQCRADLKLPGGLKIGGTLGDELAQSIVLEIQAEYSIGGEFTAGAFASWSVSCEDTKECCE